MPPYIRVISVALHLRLIDLTMVLADAVNFAGPTYTYVISSFLDFCFVCTGRGGETAMVDSTLMDWVKRGERERECVVVRGGRGGGGDLDVNRTKRSDSSECDSHA